MLPVTAQSVVKTPSDGLVSGEVTMLPLVSAPAAGDGGGAETLLVPLFEAETDFVRGLGWMRSTSAVTGGSLDGFTKS